MTSKHFLLTDVAVVAPGSLLLSYADGEQLVVNLDEIIARHPNLQALSDPKVFATAALGEWRDSVTWMNDDNLELASDNLRARALEQVGECSHEVILEWMVKHGLTLDSAAQELGLSRRMLAYYRSGAKPVPRTVALAMKGWERLEVERDSAGTVPACNPIKLKIKQLGKGADPSSSPPRKRP